MLAQELVTMSAKEVDRLEVIRRVLERRLKRVKAAQILGITARQVRRLCDAYERDGARWAGDEASWAAKQTIGSRGTSSSAPWRWFAICTRTSGRRWRGRSSSSFTVSAWPRN